MAEIHSVPTFAFLPEAIDLVAGNTEVERLAHAQAYQGMIVHGGASMVKLASDGDIGLSVAYVGEKLGFDASPWYRRHGRQDKRWEQVVGLQHENALHEEAEFVRGVELAAWLDTLGEAERASLHLRPESYVDDLYLTPMQLATSNPDVKPFSLGQSFNFLEPVSAKDDVPAGERARLRRPDLAQLPEKVRTFLDSKREYWASLGVHNGGELESFLENYFSFVDVDMGKAGQLPPEIDWLLSSEPSAAATLSSAGMVRLRRLKGTPPAVLDHIHTVNQSQNRLLSWLEPYVTGGQDPVIYDSDHDAAAARYAGRVDSLLANTKLSEFRRALLVQMTENSAAEATDFDMALQGIRNFAELAFGLEVTVPDELSESARDTLLQEVEHLNTHLDAEFGVATALEHMISDVTDRHSSSIKTTLKLAIGLIVAGESMHVLYERFPQLSILPTLVFLLAVSEDPVSEGGEAFSQRALGYSWQEIWPRYKLIGPVALASIGLGFTVKWAGDYSNESIAILDLAVASCATTAATLYKTAQSAFVAHGRQVAEGKVPGRVNLDEQAQATMRELLAAPATPMEAMEEVRELIRQSTREEVTDQDLRGLYLAIETALEDGNIEAAIEKVSVPFKESLRVAWRETIGNNPVRQGKVGGIALMLGAGPFPPLAHLVFTEAVATMLFSMGEPISGLVTSKVRGALANRLRAGRARREARRLREQNSTAPEQETPDIMEAS